MPLVRQTAITRWLSGQRGNIAVLLCFLFLSTLTVWLWRNADLEATSAARERFELHAEEARYALQQRLLAYEQVLRGVAGLFAASKSVTRDEWKTYIAALRIEINYPGIQGIGFSQRIAPQDLASHIESVRREGFPEYRVWPEGRRGEYTAIVYLEPFDWRNQRAFGYDMFSEPTRRKAMSRARDTGEPAVSGRVRLVQETDKDVQPGFLMYLPVYDSSAAIDTIAQRRDALLGYAYAPFRMYDLMRGLFEGAAEVRLRIYDGNSLEPAALMYDSAPHGTARTPAHEVVLPLELNGHSWLLQLTSTPTFEAAARAQVPRVILSAGLVISALFAMLVAAVQAVRERALALDKANAGLQEEIRERRQAQERLTYLAQYDALTGLANRALFQERLDQIIRSRRRGHGLAAVLFIDLDRFKIINDTFGHGIGDDLLKQMASRIAKHLRAGDVVSRLSGDEFAVALAEVERSEDVLGVVERIMEQLREPFDTGGYRTYVTASMGVALYPSDGTTPEELLRNSDAAMYRAKERGKNRYEFYMPGMNARLTERLHTESLLREALEKGEFLLHYQPRISTRTGQISGLEALLRWRRPGQELVAPQHFIPILEETGLITEVGEWIIREVCAQLRAWAGSGIRATPVAINVSPRQFMQGHFESVFRNIVEETGTDPACIHFEITESLLMNDPEHAIRTLRALRELGCKIAVDDFGTGYSSLAYLKRFPLDFLKIDRAFVRDVTEDPDDAAIALAVIGLAHALGLKVVAEGVERNDQFRFLASNSCDEMQGFLFSRPIPPEECTGLLAGSTPLWPAIEEVH